MCSRFALKSSPKTIAKHFGAEASFDWKPRYNIAPSQKIPAVLRPLGNPKREIRLLQWGFVVSWAQGGRLLINVRSEEIGDKPLFQESFEKWRCLIPVDGFYEWRHQGKETRPFFFRMKENQPFALAGIGASQKREDGTALEACAILTTSPNEIVRPVHERMPVIVEPNDYKLWLDSEDVRDFGELKKILRPYPASKMENYQVGSWVNNPFHEDPRCLEPSREPETLSFSF